MTDPSDAIIDVRTLSVAYGRKRVLDGVSFAVRRGEVVALLGDNGAGKSTLIRQILGLEPVRSGEVAVFGKNVWNQRATLMSRIGYVPEDADAAPDMSVGVYTEFLRRLYEGWDAALVARAMERSRVGAKQRFGDLSKGQKKRISLAWALAPAPELLVLDDPTLGLDAVSRKELFEEMIRDLADRGTTVFLTSHDLGGIEAIADRVIILRDSRIVLDERIDDLKSRFRRLRFGSPRRAETIPVVERLAPVRQQQFGNAIEVVVSRFDPDAGQEVSEAEVTAMTLEEIVILISERTESNA